jgi:hypothetical protein
VIAFRLDDGYVISLPYGADRDWARNVLAAGSCTLDTGGRRFELTGPSVLAGREGRAVLPAPVRAVLRPLRATRVLWLSASQRRSPPSRRRDGNVPAERGPQPRSAAGIDTSTSPPVARHDTRSDGNGGGAQPACAIALVPLLRRTRPVVINRLTTGHGLVAASPGEPGRTSGHRADRCRLDRRTAALIPYAHSATHSTVPMITRVVTTASPPPLRPRRVPATRPALHRIRPRSMDGDSRDRGGGPRSGGRARPHHA